MSAAELPLTASASLPRPDMGAGTGNHAGNPTPDTLWQRCCARLATELPEQQFNTWIRPLPPAEVTREGFVFISECSPLGKWIDELQHTGNVAIR